MDSTQLRELTSSATGSPAGAAPGLPGEARKHARDIVGTSQPGQQHASPALPALPATVAWGVIAIVCVVVATVVWHRANMDRRRRRPAPTADADATVPAGPDELERDADAAERRGDHALAVQLRYRAGLERLAVLPGLAIGPGSTSGQIDRVLRSASFARLARVHDRVVFMPGPATATEAGDARASWPEIVREARAR